jgi:microcin C transport system substrate-binding protein
MFESLAINSADEVATMYGLLAEDMVLAPDRMAMTFRLHPKARFNNGDEVTADDVKYSFDTLVAQGAPQFKMIYADVKQAVVLDPRTIRFDFKSANRELPLIVGGMPVFSRKWAAGTPFDKIQLVPPVASGPYLIDRYDVGRSIAFRRNPAYWGTDLPVRRGAFNFDRIVYRFYKDDLARLEAFMAGEFDVVVEYRAKNWARMYKGPKFEKGEIIKKTLTHSNGAGMQAFVMNLRRPQFKDPRVRRALGLALDFEWMNRQLFYSQYVRIDSFFSNSELAARGTPTPGELALLSPGGNLVWAQRRAPLGMELQRLQHTPLVRAEGVRVSAAGQAPDLPRERHRPARPQDAAELGAAGVGVKPVKRLPSRHQVDGGSRQRRGRPDCCSGGRVS